MATCSTSTLIAQACDNGFFQAAQANPALVQALIIQLLCNISASSGGSTQVFLYTGAAPPVTAPTDPTKPAISYSQDGSGPIFVWNVASQVWN